MATTYEPIATTTLGSAASSITFSSIPASYTDLRLVFVGTGTVSTIFRCRLNSDTTTVYSSTYLNGNGSTASSNYSNNDSYSFFLPYINTTTPFLFTYDFFSYANSVFKTCLVTISGDLNGSGDVTRGVGLWRNTTAINTITLSPNSGNFNAGTTATLYGIKNA
jgi:hypothetical protein